MPTDRPASVEQRIVDASYLLPAYGGITGWAALRWLGGRWFDGHDARGSHRPVPLAITEANLRPRPGVQISKEQLAPRHLAVVDGLALTSAVRSACFEMRYATDDDAAVVVLEMAAYSDLVSVAEMEDHAATLNGWTGIPRCRRALSWAEENSWSPQETRLRLLWRRGLEDLVSSLRCNEPVFDLCGRHLGTPDLIDPHVGVVGEYDGEVHLTRESRHLDINREAGLRAAGLEVVVMTAEDHRAPEQFIARLRAAYQRAARTPVADRGWTLQAPPWWIPTLTVEQRRSLSAADRQRLLGHRAS
ncbi:MAG: hypothetical protein F2667_09745 [Actinobacteria bacterium]|uniref:Unannotated protein n=1 Tax=freshwater metagenome TaxID=449393 RepID=A0A6J6RAE1_9ZZZZ|nr:hypothetical protein [Actinomycetota bacterium]